MAKDDLPPPPWFKRITGDIIAITARGTVVLTTDGLWLYDYMLAPSGSDVRQQFAQYMPTWLRGCMK